MHPGRAGRAVGILLLACALACLFTFPLVAKIDRAGRLDTGDGHWSIWCVAWVAHALATDPGSLYHANIFHPHRNTLAYSENNVVAGLLGLPAYLATRNAFATHNTALLLAFVLAFLGAYLLARHITHDTGASLAAALAFAYCPFMFARTAHIQLLMTFGLPFAMLALHRLVERPSAPRSLALAAALAVQALACGYYGIFAGMMVGLGVLLYSWTRGLWRRPAWWLWVAVAAIVSVGSVAPFFLPYLQVQSETGFTRTLADASMYAADWRAWLASGSWVHRVIHPLLGHRWNEVLFPGIGALVLGVAGAIVTLRGAPAVEGAPARPADRRDTAVLYTAIGVIAFWISFGPPAGLYTFLHNTLPVFSFLRAPGRFGIMVVLSLSVLAAMGLSRGLRGAAAGVRRTAFAGLFVMMAAELATPTNWRDAPRVNVAYRLLATLRPGPVVELPFFYERPDFPRHAWYMTNSTWHWQPLVNGYSDHIPQDFRDMVIPMSSFPTRESFRLLFRRRVRYAVFHLNWYDSRSREKLLDRLESYKAYLAPLSREDGIWLFEIVAWPEGTVR